MRWFLMFLVWTATLPKLVSLQSSEWAMFDVRHMQYTMCLLVSADTLARTDILSLTLHILDKG